MKTIGTYTIGASADDLDGWTAQTLAQALTGPLGELGIEVICTPRESGVNEGLSLNVEMYSDNADYTSEVVARIVEKTICG